MHVKELEVIPNMLLYGTKHGVLMLNGMVTLDEQNGDIVTGSYPQIHHTHSLKTENRWINCTEFIDANGNKYDDWIPAIMLWS